MFSYFLLASVFSTSSPKILYNVAVMFYLRGGYVAEMDEMILV